MNRNTTTKVKKEHIKYAVLDKTTKEITLYRFKIAVANVLGVSVRTLDRQIQYETDKYIVYKVVNVVL